MVCVLLDSVPELSEDELLALFRESDDSGGNMAGQGRMDVNEVVCAMIDAAEAAFEQRAHDVAAQCPNVHPAVRNAHSRPGLAKAMPVAIRLLRGLDPGGETTLDEDEFVHGMRFLIDSASTLVPPLLTNLSKERRRLKHLFEVAFAPHPLPCHFAHAESDP